MPVVARFSIAGGNPTASDADRSPRGMALEFRLTDGSRQHMTMINTPMFFAAMPRTFLDKMLALKPDPATGKPNPAALKAFAASHPDNAGQAKFLAEHNPPPSYANTPYFGIHTLRSWQSWVRTLPPCRPCHNCYRASRLFGTGNDGRSARYPSQAGVPSAMNATVHARQARTDQPRRCASNQTQRSTEPAMTA
ncbi:MAG TPA: catalase [Gemmatimonadales bacterium]|nr:catalase [Gemmatimonadales bacterium]